MFSPERLSSIKGQESISHVDGLIFRRFLETGDAATFLGELESYFDNLRPLTMVFTDQSEMVETYKLNGWSFGSDSPESIAKKIWFHERAHLAAGERLKVGGIIRQVKPIRGVLYHAYYETSVNDTRKISRNQTGKLLNIIGQVTTAPFREVLARQKPFWGPDLREAKAGLPFLERAKEMGERIPFDLKELKEKINLPIRYASY